MLIPLFVDQNCFVYNTVMAFPDWVYRVRNAPAHGITRLLICLVRVLPKRASFALGRNLGILAWTVLPKWRKTAHRNLEIMFGAKYTPKERLNIGRESAINLGFHVIEFIRMGFEPIEDALAMVVENEGEEYLHEAIAKGRGVVGLTLHYGNWEIAGAYLSNNIRQLHAVGKEQSDDFFTKIAFQYRERFGIKTIMSGNKANSAIIRALREKDVLGLVADQNGGSTGVFADFAGTLASTVPGPAALAIKFNAPMVVTYCRRIAPGKHRFVALPPINTDDLPTDRQEAIIELLSRLNAAYLKVITEDPTQWLWGHKRWKTRPPGEPGLY